MKVLLPGGAGYIGSHTALELLNAGHEVVVLDNLSNSSFEALNRVQKLTNKTMNFYEGDVCDKAFVSRVIQNERPDAVINFASLKAVGESVAIPLKYFRNNLGGAITLYEVMIEQGVKNFMFSSSATVYGDPERLPIDETCRTQVTNPYGRTKLMIEEIMDDLHRAEPSTNMVILRYFNPVGAHQSGMIGEDPQGTPNNLVPFVSQVAVGIRPEVRVFGSDYDTPDGTGVRDYLHVVDLARGHVAALKRFSQKGCFEIYNLGTGKGYSVLEIIEAFKKASGRPVPYVLVDRRPGDIASCYTDPKKAREVLSWTAQHGLDDMCRDAWNWQSKNPKGYKS